MRRHATVCFMANVGIDLRTTPSPLSNADQAYLDGLQEFVEALPPEDAALHEQLAELGRKYGNDIDREIADWKAGRHPFQQPR